MTNSLVLGQNPDPEMESDLSRERQTGTRKQQAETKPRSEVPGRYQRSSAGESQQQPEMYLLHQLISNYY